MTTHKRGGRLLLRKVLIWGLFLLGSTLLLALLGYAQLLSWLQGESFRDSLEKELANKARARSVEISGTLGIDSNHLTLRGIRLKRRGVLRAFEGRSIHAELIRSALLDKELHLTRVMVEEGSFSLDADRAKEKLPRVRKGASGFLSRLAPESVQLERFECKDFNADLRLGGRDYALTDSSLTAQPAEWSRGSGGEGSWEFRLNSGRVHTPLPVLGNSSLKDATLTLNKKLLTLSDARLLLSPGELIINAVREQESGEWSADIRANSADISRLIGEDWKKRLSGSLYGRLHADGDAQGVRQANGNLSLQQAVLEALPFLENLPVGDTYPYRSLRLNKATARINYPHEDAARNIRHAWLLDQIDLRAEGGWLRVKGYALVDTDGSLGGSLLIGLPEKVATAITPVNSPLHLSIFNAGGEEGYLWLRLNLSGTLSAPQEDLSVRLMTLMGGSLPQAADTLRNLLLPAGKDSTPAPAEEKQTTPGKLLQDAGEATGDLINTGLRTFF